MNARFDDYANVAELRHAPTNIEAEQNVLGSLMIAPAALPRIADWLSAEDFYRQDHQAIYRAICTLAEKGKPFDPVTVGEWFEAEGKSDLVAGGAYLIELHTSAYSAANIVAYAEIVRDKAKLREAIEVGTRLVNGAFAQRDCGELVANAVHDLSQLRGDPRAGGLVAVGSQLSDWYSDLEHRYEAGNKITGIPYPWRDINNITHGLQPGELTVIAARPSMGKSIMGLNLALFSALRDVNTAFFSLEMTTRQVNRRCISSLSGVPHEWLLSPDDEGDTHWGKVTDAVAKMKGAALLVDDSSGLTTSQVVARARRAHMRRPIELLVLDHVHDLAYDAKRDMRHEVGDATAAMKKLAKEFNCPAVMLAQLNRNCENRQDKRPQMSDLREAGDIEQKADVIWFLYREDYYQRNNSSWKPNHAVELILGKGRDLRVGAPVILRDEYEFMALRDWEGQRPVRVEKATKQSANRGLEEF